MSVRTAIYLVLGSGFLAAAALALVDREPAEVPIPFPPASRPPVVQAEPGPAKPATTVVATGHTGAPLDAPEPVPEIGKTYVVAIGDHVVLTNKRVGDRVRWFRRGDDCRVDPGGTMTIIDTRVGGDELGHWPEWLVRYARPPKGSRFYVAPERDAEPYDCPDGGTFWHEDPLFIAEDPP